MSLASPNSARKCVSLPGTLPPVPLHTIPSATLPTTPLPTPNDDAARATSHSPATWCMVLSPPTSAVYHCRSPRAGHRLPAWSLPAPIVNNTHAGSIVPLRGPPPFIHLLQTHPEDHVRANIMCNCGRNTASTPVARRVPQLLFTIP